MPPRKRPALPMDLTWREKNEMSNNDLYIACKEVIFPNVKWVATCAVELKILQVKCLPILPSIDIIDPEFQLVVFAIRFAILKNVAQRQWFAYLEFKFKNFKCHCDFCKGKLTLVGHHLQSHGYLRYQSKLWRAYTDKEIWGQLGLSYQFAQAFLFEDKKHTWVETNVIEQDIHENKLYEFLGVTADEYQIRMDIVALAFDRANVVRQNGNFKPPRAMAWGKLNLRNGVNLFESDESDEECVNANDISSEAPATEVDTKGKKKQKTETDAKVASNAMTVDSVGMTSMATVTSAPSKPASTIPIHTDQRVLTDKETAQFLDVIFELPLFDIPNAIDLRPALNAPAVKDKLYKLGLRRQQFPQEMWNPILFLTKGYTFQVDKVKDLERKIDELEKQILTLTAQLPAVDEGF